MGTTASGKKVSYNFKRI